MCAVDVCVYVTLFLSQGLMHLNGGRPVASFDPEGLIFAAGIESKQLKLYDLRSFDKVSSLCNVNTLDTIPSHTTLFSTSLSLCSSS